MRSRQALTLIEPTPGRHPLVLQGWWLLLARSLWLGLVIPALVFWVASIWTEYAMFAAVMEGSGAVVSVARLGVTAADLALYTNTANFLSSAAVVLAALLIFIRRSDDWVALVSSCALITFTVSTDGPLVRLAMQYPAVAVPATAIETLGSVLMVTLPFIFPSGRFVPPWTRWLVLAMVLAFVLRIAGNVLFPDTLLDARTWSSTFFVLEFSFWAGSGLAAQVYRYRTVSTTHERQQTKWVVFGMVVFAAVYIGRAVLWLVVPDLLQSGTLVYLVNFTVICAAWTVLGATFTAAILRYRLWDVDPILNRTLVYAALSASVVLLYMVMVGSVSAIVQVQNNLVISLLATGVVAVIFEPLRRYLQRGVNHLLYGERDEPYRVLSRLGHRLEATIAPDAVLPAIVQTIAETLRLPYVAIALQHGQTASIVASRGEPAPDVLRLPLVYQHDTVGALVVAARSPGERFSTTDRRLLEDLARQAGVAVHAVRVTAELQWSRARLVTAREEERRRLRRDLHDGLGPQLASLMLRLETARNRLADDAAAVVLLEDLAARMKGAVADIRRLVYQLRPPALDELGLVGAIDEFTAQVSREGPNDLSIALDVPEPLSALPAAVEVAAFRITQEAITNVVRHADARRCTVRLVLRAVEQVLCLEIIDDGHGLPTGRRAGVGLQSMRERANELGGSVVVETVAVGGTRVAARLPLDVRRDERPAVVGAAEEWEP